MTKELNNFIHRLIEQQVKKTPYAPALTYEDKELSYQEK